MQENIWKDITFFCWDLCGVRPWELLERKEREIRNTQIHKCYFGICQGLASWPGLKLLGGRKHKSPKQWSLGRRALTQNAATALKWTMHPLHIPHNVKCTLCTIMHPLHNNAHNAESKRWLVCIEVFTQCTMRSVQSVQCTVNSEQWTPSTLSVAATFDLQWAKQYIVLLSGHNVHSVQCTCNWICEQTACQ